MKINLSTVSQFVQAVSLVFQEILALESQQTSSHSQNLPSAQAETSTSENQTPVQ
ncbi:hypothetical protein [Nostoc sp.]|uniref:hypothetical protein n=1 Tax=Nostoc sp. TaxID=1180 RepID=UPI002FFC3FBB